ncbi:MAG: hypothetical protein ACKO04_12675 [Actinomycetes bacterium]
MPDETPDPQSDPAGEPQEAPGGPTVPVVPGAMEVEVELDDFLDDSGETDEVPDPAAAVDADESGDGRITYDATPWAAETRTMLTSLLEGEGITHAWQGTEVTVHESDEEAVDRIITEVLAAAAPALDPAAPKVVYGVSGWSAALQTELVDALTDASVPFEWNVDGDLVVHASDEEQVEELLDALPDDEDGGGADDGLVLHETLDRLFVAADRLARKPTDARATVDAVEGSAALAAMSIPFGFDASAWDRLVGQASGLADALDGGDEEADAPAADADVAELAAALRSLVAQYV